MSKRPNASRGDRSISNEEKKVREVMSNYELERMKRIKENEKLLKSLKIFEAKEEFENVMKKPAKPVRQQGLRDTVRTPKEVLPPRKSLRLRNLDPEGIPVPERPHPKGDQLQVRVRQRTVPLKCANEVSNEDQKAFCNSLSLLGGDSAVDIAKYNDYDKELQKLALSEQDITKVTQGRITTCAFHPTTSKLLVAAGDKYGGLGLWDVESQQGQKGVFFYSPHVAGLTCLAFPPSPGASSVLYTSSYDGSIKCMDVERELFDEVYGLPHDLNDGFTHLSLDSSGGMILGSSIGGDVMLVDVRSHKRESVWEMYNRKVKTIHLNPMKESIFVTACVNGSVNTWDLRYIKKNPEPLQSMKFFKSVSSAYYSPLSGKYLVTTSLDNRIRLYKSASAGGPLDMVMAFYHDNQVGRWLTNFRAVWDPKSDEHYMVGKMPGREDREIQVYSVISPVPTFQLRSDSLSSICCVNASHPKLNVIAGTNSSGKCYLWRESV